MRESLRWNRNSLTTAEQGAAPDRLQLRSFLATLPAAGELGRSIAARGFPKSVILNDMTTDYMIPIQELSDDPDDEKCLYRFAQTAKSFLLSQNWCDEIKAAYLAYGVDGVLGAFFFEIIPAKSNIDNQLWVIAGDVPPAYLVFDENPNPSDALDGYVYEMRRWVEAVKSGQRIDNLIPVCYQDSTNQVPPSLEFSEMLEGRLQFIEDEMIPDAKSQSL